MNYNRVVPRDLFNESKLLKCLGQISVNIDGKLREYGTTDELTNEKLGFIITQDESGNISCINYNVYAQFGSEGPVKLKLHTGMNSRLNYPLICETIYSEHIYVFDDKGKFSKEFISYLKVLYNFKG